MAYAKTGEKAFDLGNGLTAVAHREKTRMAFRHLARLSRDGNIIARAKIAYQNRTWESYEYQSVLARLVDAAKGQISKDDYDAAVKALADYRAPNPFGTVAMAAAIGSLLSDNLKEQNDFKKRMVSTVPGIIMPDNFDSLPEEERARRLDGVLKMMREP